MCFWELYSAYFMGFGAKPFLLLIFFCSYFSDEWHTAEPGGFRLLPNGAKQAHYPSCAKKMGPLITEPPPPSSPYDYSPHVLPNSFLHRNYCDIQCYSPHFHSLFSLKITCRLTSQVNPLYAAELNVSWEKICLRTLCLFYATRNHSVKFILKGLKAYWCVNSSRQKGGTV